MEANHGELLLDDPGDGPHSRPGTASRIGAQPAALRALQYSRLVSALDRLPDAYLHQAGLRRSDIPEHARRIVYDSE